MLEFSVQTQRHATATDRNGYYGNECGVMPASDNSSSAADMRPVATNTSGKPAGHSEQ